MMNFLYKFVIICIIFINLIECENANENHGANNNPPLNIYDKLTDDESVNHNNGNLFDIYQEQHNYANENQPINLLITDYTTENSLLLLTTSNNNSVTTTIMPQTATILPIRPFINSFSDIINNNTTSTESVSYNHNQPSEQVTSEIFTYHKNNDLITKEPTLIAVPAVPETSITTDSLATTTTSTTTTTPNIQFNLTTLLPANFQQNSYNDDFIITPIISTSANNHNLTVNLNDKSELIDENSNYNNTDLDYETHLLEMNENMSTSIEDTIAFDMKHNILYTEELNGNIIKMTNSTEFLSQDYAEHIDNETSQLINNSYIEDDINKITTRTSNSNNSDMNFINAELLLPATLPYLITTTTSSSTTTNRSKQGKQIQIDINKQQEQPEQQEQQGQPEQREQQVLMPHERLQQFLEDPYIRKPLAAIIDPTTNTLEQIKSLWSNALKPNTTLDIILLGINATGVSVIYNFTNTRTFLAGLNSLKESEPGNPFYGILKATELIPYDSAIFISAAASIPSDTVLGQQAGIALLKKRIRLYLVWFGDEQQPPPPQQNYSDNQELNDSFSNVNAANNIAAAAGILGKIAIRSGGEIFHMRTDGDDLQELEENMVSLVNENYRGAQDIDIPIDTTITNLNIKIDTLMKTATLQTPTGEINLKKFMKLEFIKFLNINQPYYDMNIHLDPINYSDVLKIRLVPEIDGKRYCLSITGKNNQNYINDKSLQSLELATAVVKNQRNSFRESRHQHFSHENLRFPKDSELNEDDDDDNNMSSIELTESIYKLLNNQSKNSQQQQNSGILQGITKIEMGIQSQVLVAPGMMAQLYFEVTNFRTEPIIHNILVVDERSFLRSINQRTIRLAGGQTTTVIVTLMVPSTTPQSTTDKITFTCQGNGQTSQSVNLKVISNQEAQDLTPPYVTWNFGTRCDGNYYNQAQCSTKFWSLEVLAQDYETGILRITSTPTGIYPRIPFTVGSIEPAHATYTASCCQPRVTISVYDLAGNQRTHTIDVRDIIFTEASIAAITLGVILLILLIIALIVLIVWCCKRRKSASRDLPSYRSQPIERARGG